VEKPKNNLKNNQSAKKKIEKKKGALSQAKNESGEKIFRNALKGNSVVKKKKALEPTGRRTDFGGNRSSKEFVFYEKKSDGQRKNGKKKTRCFARKRVGSGGREADLLFPQN